MKENLTAELLSVLATVCSGGEYVVVSAKELKKKSRALSSLSGENLERLFAVLEDRGYVSLRYSDGEEFCVALLTGRQNYNPFPERNDFGSQPKISRLSEIKAGNAYLKVALISAFGGFAGGFIGAVIAFLLVRAAG